MHVRSPNSGAGVKGDLKSASVKGDLKSAGVKGDLKSAGVKGDLKSAGVCVNRTLGQGGCEMANEVVPGWEWLCRL